MITFNDGTFILTEGSLHYIFNRGELLGSLDENTLNSILRGSEYKKDSVSLYEYLKEQARGLYSLKLEDYSDPNKALERGAIIRIVYTRKGMKFPILIKKWGYKYLIISEEYGIGFQVSDPKSYQSLVFTAKWKAGPVSI